MVDFHGRTSPAAAIQYARVLAPYRPWFIEEPCQPENIDAMLEVTRAVGIPVATGERLYSRYEVRELLEKRVCAVLQTDGCHAGGITELRRSPRWQPLRRGDGTAQPARARRDRRQHPSRPVPEQLPRTGGHAG
jgi:hypothetical protein